MVRRIPEGQKQKFLLLCDDSEEADRALSLAARRALRFNLGIVLLAAVNPDDFSGTHLFGAGDMMRQELHEKAEERLERAKSRLKRLGVSDYESVILEKKPADAVLQVIHDDQAIFSLVLAASTSNEGSGPLVSSLAKSAGHYPVPIIIVPGRLSDDEIAALS
jgi:nucleotide-binding universal stress UspA family protein